jgi:hypothetical protein
MKRIASIFVVVFFLLSACSPSTPVATSAPLTVQYTFAATSWLADLYTCTGGAVVRDEPRSADMLDPGSADLVLRIGQPANLTSPAYQIGTEDILVVVNKQNPINRLSADQVSGLFTGRIQTWKDINKSDAAVAVWVFPAGEDVQQLFEGAALGGAPASSDARLAITPDEMARAVAGDVNAIGILPRHWKAGNVSDVYTVTQVPVLAIVAAEPQGALAQILVCLQK